MVGAARLDIDTYEEVEADTTATGQAAAVVALAGVALAMIWSGVTYLIGSRLFHGTATWGELLRTLGFAQAPTVLAVFAIIPGIGFILLPVLSIWTLIAGVIAVRQALDFSTGKAIFTVVIGWLVLIIPRMVLSSLGMF
jgi:hypothetical protein